MCKVRRVRVYFSPSHVFVRSTTLNPSMCLIGCYSPSSCVRPCVLVCPSLPLMCICVCTGRWRRRKRRIRRRTHEPPRINRAQGDDGHDIPHGKIRHYDCEHVVGGRIFQGAARIFRRWRRSPTTRWSLCCGLARDSFFETMPMGRSEMTLELPCRSESLVCWSRRSFVCWSLKTVERGLQSCTTILSSVIATMVACQITCGINFIPGPAKRCPDRWKALGI